MKATGQICSVLRIHNCPEPLLGEVLEILTLPNPAFATASRFSPWAIRHIPQFIYLALYDGPTKVLELPRGVRLRNSLSAEARKQWEEIEWEDCRVTHPCVFPFFKGTPNAEQKELLRLAKAHLFGKTNGEAYGTLLLVAPTSAGKTFGQILLAKLLGQRALVLCKTNLIRKAWEDDLINLAGVRREDIGIIQQNKMRIGKNFTLGSIATLGRRKGMWEQMFTQFGTLIIDEAQITGGDTVAAIARNAPCKYVLGLTATPKRRDGRDKVVTAYLGRPAGVIANKQEETHSSLPLSDAEMLETGFIYVDSRGRDIDGPAMVYTDLLARMSSDHDRNDLIVDRVVSLHAEESNNCILVVSERVEHLHTLALKLRSRGVGASVLTGDVMGTERELIYKSVLSRQVRVLLATKSLIKLGANLNTLNWLVLATPTNADDLEQLIGRVRRKAPGKTYAKLLYVLDTNVPYLHRKWKNVFFPVMRKLKVPRYENMFVG